MLKDPTIPVAAIAKRLGVSRATLSPTSRQPAPAPGDLTGSWFMMLSDLPPTERKSSVGDCALVQFSEKAAILGCDVPKATGAWVNLCAIIGKSDYVIAIDSVDFCRALEFRCRKGAFGTQLIQNSI